MAGTSKIYLFSGLGADRRVFERLSVPGELVHIEWLAPLTDEILPQYANRLIEANGIENNRILLGVSFGGMVAVEVAKLIRVKQVILISSVPHRQQVPILFRIAGYLRLYKLLPYSLLKKHNLFLRYAFSPISDEEYDLLKKIVADTDTFFLKWAIKQILLWQNTTMVQGLVHLHGTKDKIFPFKPNIAIIPIPNGGHFMVYNRAEEVSEIVRKILR